jgi:hypothetical protein
MPMDLLGQHTSHATPPPRHDNKQEYYSRRDGIKGVVLPSSPYIDMELKATPATRTKVAKMQKVLEERGEARLLGTSQSSKTGSMPVKPKQAMRRIHSKIPLPSTTSKSTKHSPQMTRNEQRRRQESLPAGCVVNKEQIFDKATSFPTINSTRTSWKWQG